MLEFTTDFSRMTVFFYFSSGFLGAKRKCVISGNVEIVLYEKFRLIHLTLSNYLGRYVTFLSRASAVQKHEYIQVFHNAQVERR